MSQSDFGAMKRTNRGAWERKIRHSVRKFPTMAKAAEDLGISWRTLRRYCAEIGLDTSDPKNRPRVA